MLNLVDIYGQWHVKECIEGKPSGNDGLVVSVYAEKAGLPVNTFDIRHKLWHNLSARRGFPIERTPGKETPYPSRDFYLAARWFDLEKVRHLEIHGWNFSPFPIPEFDLIKFIKQAWEAIGKDRNYFWQNKLDQLYRFAFSIPLHDRAYYYKLGGQEAPLIYEVIEFVDKYLVVPDGNSSKLLRWLKYNQEPSIEVFEEYFGPNHLITIAMRIKKNKAE